MPFRPQDPFGTPPEATPQLGAHPQETQYATGGPTSDVNSSIAHVESNSAGLLPTRTILDLAGLTVDDKAKAVAARKMARQWDIAPQVLFGDGNPRKIVSRITGVPVTMKDALRFTNRFEPVAIASMLADVMPSDRAIAQRTGSRLDRTPDVGAGEVAKFANVIARHTTMDLSTGIALAYQLSKERFSPQRFEQNYDLVARWWASGNGGATNEETLATIAIAISRKGQAHSIEDIGRLLYGKAAYRASESLKARIAAAEAQGVTITQEDIAIQQGIDQSLGSPIEAASLGPNYWKVVQETADRVKLADDAVHRSLIGTALRGAGAAFNWTWVTTEKGLVQLGFTLVAPVALGIAAVDPNSDVKGTLENITRAHENVFARIDAGQTIGQITVEGYNARFPGLDIPDWVGTAMDFGVGWYLDPFALAGRAAAASRAGRLLIEDEPTLFRTFRQNVLGGASYRAALRAGEDTSGFGILARASGNRFLELEQARINTLTRNVLKLSDSRLSTRLFSKLGDSTQFFRELDVAAHGGVATRTLDYTYMQLLRNNLIERFSLDGLGSAEARAAWNDGLKAHFLGYGPEGSVAEQTVLERLSTTNALKGAADDVAARQLSFDFHNLEDGMFLPSRGSDAEWHLFTSELPNRGAFGEFGPRRLVRRAATSDAVTSNALGRKIAALPNINPGRKMPLFGDGAWEYVVQNSRRWTTFTEKEVQGFAEEVRAIQASGVSVEARLTSLMDNINDTALRRVLEPYNLSEDAYAHVKSLAFDRTAALNKRAEIFGINRTGQAIDTPLLESQLKNFTYVVDPVRVRTIVREYTGTLRRMRARFTSAIGRDVPEIANAIDSLPHNIAVKIIDGSGEAMDTVQHLWKALTVARPGYIPRVILGDENLRFLATTRSGFERIASQEWFGLTKWLDEKGLFTREFVGPDGKPFASVGLPGAYERNAAANGAIRTAELDESMLKTGKNYERAFGQGSTWEVVTAKTPDAHLQAWTWNLSKQMPNSAPGRIALESIAAGDDLATTQAKLVQWANEDRFVTLRTRIGVAPDEVQDWANDLSFTAHSYTMDNASIAEAALKADAKDLRRVLEGTPIEARPAVHGPSVTALTSGQDATWGTRTLNKMYEKFVSNPESKMNRQPFYKAMKRRAEQGYYRLLEDAASKDPNLAKLIAGEFKPRVLSPTEDLSSLVAAGDKRYYYHVSPAPNTESIRAQGVLPHQTTYGINPESIAPEMRGGRAFVGETPDVAMNATRSVENKVLIRIPREDVPKVFPDSAPVEGSFYARSAIPTTNAEVMGADGVWHPIGSTRRSVPGISPRLLRHIDEASTQFALEQVNKVMFDLTKQSRFTELLQFAFPFPQPFFEGFQAWGHLVRKNPEIVARARALYRLGMETGFLKEDPLTGEIVVPLAPVAGLAKILGQPFGLTGKRFDDLGIRFIAPLSGFNMLAQTTVQFGPDGPLGKLIGGVPIPVPGLNPIAAGLFQKAFANTTNSALISYLFQFGPSAQFMPRSLSTAIKLIFPDAITDPYEGRLADTLLRTYQHARIGFDAQGNPTMTEDELVAMAKRDAHALTQARAIAALFSPASPRLETASAADEALFQTYVDKYGDNYTGALDAWNKDHPDLWMVPVGKTYYEGLITDPGTGESVRGPRLNASRIVLDMLNTPGIGDVMKRDKAWAGLLLLGLPSEVTQAQDFPTYARLLADGTYRYKTPEEFLAEGVDRKVWSELDKFYAHTWNPGMDYMDANGLDTQDTFYTGMVEKRREFFGALALQYPGWAARNLAVKENADGTKVYDWPTERSGPPTDLVIAHATQLVAQPGFEQFPGIQALSDYLDLRKKTRKELAAAGYSSITQDSATDIADRFARGVDAITTATPGFDQYLSALLGVRTQDGHLLSSDDLQNLNTSKAQDYASLPPAIRPAVEQFDTQMELLKQATQTGYDTSTQRSERYLDLQKYADAQMATDPKVVRGWWKSLGETGRTEYRQNLVTKPPEFYTRWDWSVMGVKLNTQAANYWEQIAQARINIANDREKAILQGTDFSTGDAYDQVNKWIADKAKTNKSFAESIRIANDWSFPFKAGGLADTPGRVGAAWKHVIAATEAIQGAVESAGIVGAGGLGNTDQQNAWYIWQQDSLQRYIKQWRDYSPAFDQSWRDFQADLGDPIIGTIILPDTYYGPLGVTNYG